jgi:nicotinic acid mononucleotide adenylyltransferase
MTVKLKRSAAFTFGRMNPPTTGHLKLVEVLKRQPGDRYVFLSHTTHPKTDPLPYSIKKQFVSEFFTSVTVGDDQASNIIDVLKLLESKGYTDIVMVVGSDRVKSFDALLKKYNNQEYSFDTISVVSAGERDPDSADVSGMSGSRQRQLVRVGDRVGFSLGVPKKVLSDRLFDKLCEFTK